jgi:hypothetical protein
MWKAEIVLNHMNTVNNVVKKFTFFFGRPGPRFRGCGGSGGRGDCA